MKRKIGIMVVLNCEDDEVFEFSNKILNALCDDYDLESDCEFTITTDGVICNAIGISLGECMIDLINDDILYKLNFISKNNQQLVNHLARFGVLKGWYKIDVTYHNDPKNVITLINNTFDLKLKKRINKPKLFVSCPMNDCNSKKEVMERLQILRKIAVYIFQKDFEVINTWIDEEPPKDVKNQRAWYAGKSLELLSEADYYLGIKDLPQKFYGCHVENYTAKTLNIKSSYIDYNLFKLFDAAEITKILDINIHYIDPFVEASYD